MNKITLSVAERAVLPTILPEAGRKIEIILANDLIEKVEFSIEEISEFELRDYGEGRIAWNKDKERDKEIELSEEQVTLLKNCSTRLDGEGKVTRYNLSLLQKIDKI